MKPKTYTAGDYRIVALRELPLDAPICDEPAYCVNYWREHVVSHPFYSPDVECLVALMLNTRRRVIGHHLISTGLLDTLLAHARETFRAAIIANAAAIVLMHNHPSGDPAPSEADITITRHLYQAGNLLNIDLLDHVIVGQPTRNYCSLRELGYLYEN